MLRLLLLYMYIMNPFSKIPTLGAIRHAALKHFTFLPDRWFVDMHLNSTIGGVKH